MTTFDGPPLVAGTIHGFRHFEVRPGSLYLRSPLRTGYRWKPEENTASCGDYGWLARHHVAEQFCECGFYAYRYPWFSAYGSPRRAMGVIEAYGRVSVGRRGFRAEKARLVAVCIPRGAGRRWLWLLGLACVLALLMGTYLVDEPLGSILYVVSLFLWIGSLGGAIVSYSWDTPRREMAQNLREAYPHTKVYRSRLLMILHYLPQTRKKVELG